MPVQGLAIHVDGSKHETCRLLMTKQTSKIYGFKHTLEKLWIASLLRLQWSVQISSLLISSFVLLLPCYSV